MAELVKWHGGVLQPVLPMGGAYWFLGIIRDHQAHPLTKDEIDQIIADLAELTRLREANKSLRERVGYEGIGSVAGYPTVTVLQCRNCGEQKRVRTADFQAGKYDVKATDDAGAREETR